MQSIKLWMIAAISAMVLSACGGGDAVKPADTRDAVSTTPNTGNTGPSTGTITTVTPPGTEEELMRGKLAERSVYFDLDSYVVKDQYRDVVVAHADFLKKNPQRKVKLEGNADERGSREYNLALGQKRAEAVKSMMRTLGVSEAQLEAVSFGEERPKNPGHDETAYAENRRSDIVYPRP